MSTTIARNNWVDTVTGTVHKNDVYVDSEGQFVMATGKDCHAQVIEAVIKTLKGELQLNVNAGIPYFETIFNNNRLAGEWAQSVRSAVNELDFVVSIDGFEYSYEFYNNKLTYKLTVTTDDGEVTVTEGV